MALQEGGQLRQRSSMGVFNKERGRITVFGAIRAFPEKRLIGLNEEFQRLIFKTGRDRPPRKSLAVFGGDLPEKATKIDGPLRQTDNWRRRTKGKPIRPRIVGRGVPGLSPSASITPIKLRYLVVKPMGWCCRHASAVPGPLCSIRLPARKHSSEDTILGLPSGPDEASAPQSGPWACKTHLPLRFGEREAAFRSRGTCRDWPGRPTRGRDRERYAGLA